MTEIPNFIEVYKNALSKQTCEEFINYFDQTQSFGLTKNRQQAEYNVPNHIKDDSFAFIEANLTDSIPLHHTKADLADKFNKVFWEVAYKQYANKYTILSQAQPHNNYAIKIQKTRPGQGYHVWHHEAEGRETCMRLLAWTAYLNDNFDAGETEFLYQQYRYTPNQGDIVIFPAAFTHTHRGNPPIGGDKYIITGWIEF